MSYILPTINTSHLEINKTSLYINKGLPLNEIVLNKSLFDYLSSAYDYIKHRNINIKKNNFFIIDTLIFKKLSTNSFY